MGGVASSKACCCWHNSSTNFRTPRSLKLAINLEDEEFQSAHDAPPISARSTKGVIEAPPPKSSTQSTYTLNPNECFASAESRSPLKVDSVMRETAAETALDSEPLLLSENQNSFVECVKNANQISRGCSSQQDSYTSTSADGGMGPALSSYAESAAPTVKSYSRAQTRNPQIEEHQSAQTTTTSSVEVIESQLRTLGGENSNSFEFSKAINEIWLSWYYPEARRFYSASCNLLRARKLRDDWFGAREKKVRSDEMPTVEETLWIYRFVMARQGNVKAALDMLQADLTWREEMNVEALCHESVSQSFKQALCTLYPHGYYGCDKQGRPVYYDRLGCINAKKLLEEFSQPEIERYWIRGYELLLRTIFPSCSLAAGRRIYRGVSILDLHGMSMTTFSRARELLNVLIHVSQNHYPECMEKTYIIRSGWAFRAMWRLIKPLLSAETVLKVHFIDSGQELEVLRDEIEDLPPFIADAKNESIEWCLEPGHGPWLNSSFDASFSPPC